MPFVRDPLVERVIACAIEVHRVLGPGLLETVYERCLEHELMIGGIRYAAQQPLALIYKGIPFGSAYRMDLVVEQRLVVEVKAVEQLRPIHSAQLLTYLRFVKLRQGLLVNFNELRLVDGLKSVVLGAKD
jgi:GxxExxY protein